MGKFTVYLAGKITGNDDYVSEFARAEWKVKEILGDDILILNPMVLPRDIDYNKAINITSAMLREADMVVLLKNWKHSRGAEYEKELAEQLGKKIIELENYKIEIKKLSEDIDKQKVEKNAEKLRKTQKS